MTDKPKKSEPFVMIYAGVNHGKATMQAMDLAERARAHLAKTGGDKIIIEVASMELNDLKLENEELRRALEFWPQFMDMLESSPSDVSDFEQFTNEFYEVRAALKGGGSNV